MTSPAFASDKLNQLSESNGSLKTLAGWATVFWIAWMAILPLGHVTGLRNALAFPAILLGIGLGVRQIGWCRLADTPALCAWFLLLAWCAFSALWSPAPDVTWSKFRSDLLLPFGAYLSAYCIARFTGSTGRLLIGPLIGTALLSVLSVFAWVTVPDWIKTDVPFGTVAPMPFWYPGVGDASAYSVLLIGPLLAWWMAGRKHASAITKWGPTLLTLAILAVIVATNRRNALIVPLVITPLFFVLLGRDGKPVPRKFVGLLCAGLVLAIVLVAGIFEFGARERLMPTERAALAPNTSAALMLMKGEPRPRIWAWYLDKAQQHPWIGVGFGRTVPAIFYKSESNQTLAAIDPLAVVHAHNLVLNWVLQVGLIGFAIFAALLVTIVRCAWQARVPSSAHRLLSSAVLVTVVAMLVRNMTDDFLVYGIAIMFWATIGALLGLLERQRPVM